MIAGIDWANVQIAGAFGVGLIAGIVVTIRLAKVLAQFLGDLRRHDREENP